jgi:hypothetical protein
VYWFRRPPYLRWIAASLILAGALWMDLRGKPTEPRPFTVSSIAAGDRIVDEMLEYREVPVGVLPEVNVDGYAMGPLSPGEPLTPSVISDRDPLPDGWWAMEMEVPTGAGSGAVLRLVIEGAATVVPGLITNVVSAGQSAGWVRETAMVAVPSDQASAVATALTDGKVSVLVVDW